MKEIELTQGMKAKVSDEDFEYLSQWKWHARNQSSAKHHSRKRFYALRTVRTGESGPGGSRHVRMSHAVVGYPDPGMVCDHINGDTLDNRRENLRIISYTENAFNRRQPEEPFL
jgi:hypothetical protein